MQTKFVCILLYMREEHLAIFIRFYFYMYIDVNGRILQIAPHIYLRHLYALNGEYVRLYMDV